MTDFPTIGLYRQRLDDIRDWRTHLTDVMLTISGYSMDLTGIRGTTTRIPGGDALVMLAPWAPDATHGDDLPHPDQIIREWAHTIHDAQGNVPPHGTWATHWRFLRDQVPWILESPWAGEWQQDVDALWHRLARLTGNAPTTEDQIRGAEDCLAAADLVPDDTMLTARDADRFWPGIEARLKDDRHHRRPVPDRDEHRRYRVGDLRAYMRASHLQNTA